MAGSGKIVADDGGRIPADEKSAGITNPIGDVIRFGHEHFNVLRSNQINQSDGRVLVSDKECNTTFLYCGSCDRVAFERAELYLYFIEYRCGEGLGPANQPDT